MHAYFPEFISSASVLGVYQETRIGIVQALWNYVKLNQLQDKVDRRLVRADDALRPVSVLRIHCQKRH
jgi:chromatin remodeling complex protein RSC6